MLKVMLFPLNMDAMRREREELTMPVNHFHSQGRRNKLSHGISLPDDFIS
jgi:hypothetical protein